MGAHEEKVERVTTLLRTLRQRLDDGAGDDAEAWELDLYSYDEALVTAADLFDIEVAPTARDEMGPDDRQWIEESLADAGLDIRAR